MKTALLIIAAIHLVSFVAFAIVAATAKRDPSEQLDQSAD